MILRIANAAGFLGDNVDAPRRLVEAERVDFLTLEYLAELTLSILARVREKDPAAGYAVDFIEVLASLTRELAGQKQLHIVTNAGGMNPLACARAAANVLAEAGLSELPIAVVTGDDLLPRLAELQQAGCQFAHLDTGQPLAAASVQPVSANAYLGAEPLARALAGGARIVIAGRVADASLTVAPAVHQFGWQWDELDKLAAASVAGHIIECGAQATGGLYRHWQEIDLGHVGYPIAEIEADGQMIITKPAGSGGVVNRQTISEQLLYEIGDPAHYLTPDVDVDFSGLHVAELAGDRVAVRGAVGRRPPDAYKVSLAYRAGYMASGQLLVYGPDCVSKARACGEMVFQRLHSAGWDYDLTRIECLGAGAGVPLLHEPPADLREVVLRITVRDARREAVERFARELVPLATSGPPGLAGYTAARGSVRPVFAYWPTTVPKPLVSPHVEVKRACQWMGGVA